MLANARGNNEHFYANNRELFHEAIEDYSFCKRKNNNKKDFKN
jgi:hypothetical protein